VNKLWIVGIGPGHEDYMLPIAKEKIKAAQVLVGGKRHLAAFSDQKEKWPLKMPLEAMMTDLKKIYKEKQVAVLVSGDTGFYSMLKMVKRHFEDEDIITYPGLSSLSYMFSKLNLSYEEALMTSCHGRDITPQVFDQYPILGLLTDREHSPRWIQDQCKNRRGKIHIGLNLSYEDEVIMTYALDQEIPEIHESLCVVVVEYE
jgi:cobalt-precorrin-7 (C5)-methyltransferase